MSRHEPGEKRQRTKRSLKEMFTSRTFRVGGYSMAACAIVVLIAIVANLAVGALPTSVTQLDLTDDALYTLSDQTRRIVSALDEPVTLTYLTITGQEDSAVRTLLERYADLSSQVKIETLDPIENPGTAQQYADGEPLTANSVVVSCGDRSRYISYNDIYVVEYYMDYYSYGYSYTTSFNGEQELTSAIYYVTTESLPVVYTLEGHGESELSESLQTLIEQDNMTLETLSLPRLEAVPEDAAAVIIHAPQSDLSQDEADRLRAYLDASGSVLLITDYIEPDAMPNLLAVAEHMGVTTGEGMIIEGDANYCVSGYAYYLLPDVMEHEITQPLIDGRYYAMTPMAQPLEAMEEVTDATVTTLLQTSASSYAKAEGYDMQTTEQEEDDAVGPFSVAMASQRGDGKLVWVSSAMLLDDMVNSMVGGANHDLFLNALGWMSEREESIAIRAKSLDSDYLTVTSAQASLWSVILIGVIPGVLVAAGIWIWIRRKRR